MLGIKCKLNPEWKNILTGITISILAGVALLGADRDAQAGYSCTENGTQIGNSVTMEVVATSGGSRVECRSVRSVDVVTNTVVSSTITSGQVGATSDNVVASASAYPVGIGPIFFLECAHSSLGGPCITSSSAFITGVDFVECRLLGEGGSALPDPALPLVPVVVTTVCTINY